MENRETEQKNLQVIDAQEVDKSEPQKEKTWWLTPAEKFAYEKFLAKILTKGYQFAPIAETTREGCFSLFLNGRTLSEIQNANNKYSFGQIVHAAVTDNWQEKRQLYIECLTQRAKLRAIQTTAESLDLAADLVAVLRKQYGQPISLFLQTGNVADLGKDFSSFSIIRQLKELSDLLGKLTGADQVKRVNVQGSIEHTSSVSSVPLAPAPSPSTSNPLKSWAAVELDRLKKEDAGG